MTKRAFLFAGQGAQKLGMASDLYAAYPVVKETFDTASRILGYDLRELIDSNEEKLNQTRYTQPAILTTSVAFIVSWQKMVSLLILLPASLWVNILPWLRLEHSHLRMR